MDHESAPQAQASSSTSADPPVTTASSSADPHPHPTPVPEQPDSGSSHRRRRPRRPHDPTRPTPPRCIAVCISQIEVCGDDLQECSDNNEKRQLESAKRRRTGAGTYDDPTWTGRGNRPDPRWKQKGIIPLVFLILSWVYLVYTWRLCAPAIRESTAQDSHPVRLASRSVGIGLLVGFNVLWLVTIWAYVKALVTGPGFVKDYVQVEEQPPSLQRTWIEKGEGGPYLGPGTGTGTGMEAGAASVQQNQEQGQGQNPTPKLRRNSSTVALPGVQGEDGVIADEAQTATRQSSPHEDDHPVDPSLPAMIGPFGAGALAAAADDQQADSASTQPQRHEESHSQREASHSHSHPHPQSRPQSKDSSPTHDSQSSTGVDHTRTIAPPAPPPDATLSHGSPPSELPKPNRIPPTPDYAPLAPANRYCHRCSHVKPYRAHHCRHCGTCVLKMDHHCPWVGGCVGARNHKFFFHFVFWVTLLEFYVLISSAILFSRGALQKTGYNQWTLDGFVISLFPICAIFILFTFSLLITHFYLLCTNQSTIDHLAFSRTTRKEEFALSDYAKRLQKQQLRSRRQRRKSVSGSVSGSGSAAGLRQSPGTNPFATKRKLKKEWDAQWGRLKWEINLWKVEKYNETTSQWEKMSTLESILANFKQTMGDQWWMWILPLGKSAHDGLEYPVNPRHGPYGEWRVRSEWPKELQ